MHHVVRLVRGAVGQDFLRRSHIAAHEYERAQSANAGSGRSDLAIGWLPVAFSTCFGVCVLMALLHSCATLKAAMADSGWAETTPTHWHASQWHDALRFRSSKLHAPGGRPAKHILVSRSFDSLVPMFSDRLSRISESISA